MHIASHSGLAREFAPVSLPLLGPRPVQEVVLHHLRTPEEVENILFLRGEIDLSVHAAAGAAEFDRLEKKETKSASSADSSSAVSGSARFASCRSVTT